MNTFLFILAGLIVIAGSILIGLAPIWKQHEKRLRVLGVSLTFAGGVLGIVIGLRSAAKTDTLLKSSQQASSYASGGDSRPEIFPRVITREDGQRGVGFYLIKRGRYPLYGLTVNIGKPHRDPANPDTLMWGQDQCRSLQFQELQTESSRLVCFQPLPKEDPAYYNGDLTARNGHWDEVIIVRRTGSGDFAIRWVLYESRDLTISPNQLVFDLADDNFPSVERKTNIHPLSKVLPP
jgi:hypothetical protein